ncbi:MAG: hypothetical protein HYS23_07690 [Geobacter sp.]|nr:hypothetical protein [Geobacter sp.]
MRIQENNTHLILRSSLQRLFAPTYDELTLFVISFTCVLFFASEFKSAFGQGNLSSSANGAGPILLSIIIVGGIALSFYHSFSKRKKTRIEKQIMFIFAAFVSAFSGIWAGTYMLSAGAGHMAVFPILNIASSYMLLTQIKERAMDEDCVEDRNARLLEVLVSASIAMLIFFVSHHLLHHHWAATLSITVAYATNLNRIIVNFLGGKFHRLP